MKQKIFIDESFIEPEKDTNGILIMVAIFTHNFSEQEEDSKSLFESFIQDYDHQEDAKKLSDNGTFHYSEDRGRIKDRVIDLIKTFDLKVEIIKKRVLLWYC